MARVIQAVKRRHQNISGEETDLPPSPNEVRKPRMDSSFEPEISKEAEVQAIYTLQYELFAPASIATDTLEAEFIRTSTKLSLLERLIRAPNAIVAEQEADMFWKQCSQHDASEMKRRNRAQKMERERLLRYMDQLLLQENNPSLVNMEVEIMVPQKPCDVVIEDEDIAPPQYHTRAEEYLNRIFEQ